MNKETIEVSAEVKTFLHDLYSQIEYELKQENKQLQARIVELEQELEDRAYIELKESYFRLQEENKNLLDRIYRLIKEPTDIGLVLVELDRWLKKEVAYKEVENKLKELLVEHILGDIND